MVRDGAGQVAGAGDARLTVTFDLHHENTKGRLRASLVVPGVLASYLRTQQI